MKFQYIYVFVQAQDTVLGASDYCTHYLQPFVSVTFAQVIQNDPSIVKKFLDIMCAEEIARHLRAMDLIPEATKRDILERSRDGEDANNYLLMYLKDKAKEETVREILKYASEVPGYGKMNVFAASLLEKLQ